MGEKAILRFAKISPLKMRFLIPLIKGRPVNSALAVLQFINRKGARILEKLLRSAVANALQKKEVEKDSLIVKEVLVDEGPRWRRMRARARGSAFPIRKKTSHVTILLENISIPKKEVKNGTKG